MITINKYVCDLPAIPAINYQSLQPWVDSREIIIGNPIDDSYFLAWGDPVHKRRYGVMETGFFFNAVHIDTIGLYASCSLNTPEAKNEILNFVAPRPAAEIILGSPVPTKFPQVSRTANWKGIVLALQNPSDRSIHRGASTEDYFRFVEGACQHYGRDLFLKLHPWNSGPTEARLREIAKKYRCAIDRVNHSVLDHCAFCLVYNSTFVVDCLLRGVKVAQFAPGYFYQCPGVYYTKYNYPQNVPNQVNDGHKLCDFLVWRYCWPHTIEIAKIVEIIKIYASSRTFFPLPLELSYGNLFKP